MLSCLICVRLCTILWTAACQAPLSMILQVRTLEWIATPFSRGASWPRTKPESSTLQASMSHQGSLPSKWILQQTVIWFNSSTTGNIWLTMTESRNFLDSRNLEKWYWWTYLHGSNGEADIENRLVDAAVEGEGRGNWEAALIHTHHQM